MKQGKQVGPRDEARGEGSRVRPQASFFARVSLVFFLPFMLCGIVYE